MSNAQRTPFGTSLNAFAEQKIYNALQRNGQRLPCSVVSASGAIVTIKFEVLSPFTLPQIQVPIVGSEYIRLPIQPGDRGYVSDASVRLGAITGLGGGVPDLTQPSNLGALVFFPIGNKNWSAVDADTLTMYGPNGVTLYDAGKNSTFSLTPTSIVLTGKTSLTVQAGGNSIYIDATGVYLSGNVYINSQPYSFHSHSGVTTGASTTGPVV